METICSPTATVVFPPQLHAPALPTLRAFQSPRHGGHRFFISAATTAPVALLSRVFAFRSLVPLLFRRVFRNQGVRQPLEFHGWPKEPQSISPATAAEIEDGEDDHRLERLEDSVGEQETEWEQEGIPAAEELECLEEEAMAGEDVGREPGDYNRRAHLFDESSRHFRKLKDRNDHVHSTSDGNDHHTNPT